MLFAAKQILYFLHFSVLYAVCTVLPRLERPLTVKVARFSSVVMVRRRTLLYNSCRNWSYYSRRRTNRGEGSKRENNMKDAHTISMCFYEHKLLLFWYCTLPKIFNSLAAFFLLFVVIFVPYLAF